MQQCVAVVLSCALALGCSHGAAKGGVIAGVGITGIGVAMAAGAFGPGGETDPEDLAFIPLTVGIVVGLTSLFIMLSTKDPDEKPAAAAPPKDPAREQRERDRARAWELTKEAAAAARQDDCAPALRLDAEVKTLDGDVHAKTFARDAAIARCLATPSPAP